MRHRKVVIKLSKTKGARAALLKNLAASLILYESITTTEAKAKAVRSRVEKYITRSKEKNLTNRRYLLRFLPTENSVNKCLDVLGPRYKDNKGGYTRIIKLGKRQGDNANLVQIELI